MLNFTQTSERPPDLENPEFLLAKARKAYEHRGYSRRWISRRLQGMVARQELTAEWFTRGIPDNDGYRRLTNELTQSTFGLDVEHYRAYKRLPDNQSLRDHMTDLELALMTLAETTAAELHRQRGSQGEPQLETDVKDAGQIVATTIAQIEQKTGRSVVQFSSEPL